MSGTRNARQGLDLSVPSKAELPNSVGQRREPGRDTDPPTTIRVPAPCVSEEIARQERNARKQPANGYRRPGDHEVEEEL
jgi:hypothetical protein